MGVNLSRDVYVINMRRPTLLYICLKSHPMHYIVHYLDSFASLGPGCEVSDEIRQSATIE